MAPRYGSLPTHVQVAITVAVLVVALIVFVCLVGWWLNRRDASRKRIKDAIARKDFYFRQGEWTRIQARRGPNVMYNAYENPTPGKQPKFGLPMEVPLAVLDNKGGEPVLPR